MTAPPKNPFVPPQSALRPKSFGISSVSTENPAAPCGTGAVPRANGPGKRLGSRVPRLSFRPAFRIPLFRFFPFSPFPFFPFFLLFHLQSPNLFSRGPVKIITAPALMRGEALPFIPCRYHGHLARAPRAGNPCCRSNLWGWGRGGRGPRPLAPFPKEP